MDVENNILSDKVTRHLFGITCLFLIWHIMIRAEGCIKVIKEIRPALNFLLLMVCSKFVLSVINFLFLRLSFVFRATFAILNLIRSCFPRVFLNLIFEHIWIPINLIKTIKAFD